MPETDKVKLTLPADVATPSSKLFLGNAEVDLEAKTIRFGSRLEKPAPEEPDASPKSIVVYSVRDDTNYKHVYHLPGSMLNRISEIIYQMVDDGAELENISITFRRDEL